MPYYYAIRVGRGAPMICTTWDECEKRVSGYPGARFKKFTTKTEAQAFAAGKNVAVKNTKPERSPKQDVRVETVACSVNPPDVIVYTDGSYAADEGTAGYSAVVIIAGKVSFVLCGPCMEDLDMHNISAEIMAAKEGILAAIDLGMRHVEIRHDFSGISSWANGEWKTNKEATYAFKELVESARNVIEVSFLQVKGHAGEIYNELADRYAKLGRNLAEPVLICAQNIPCPYESDAHVVVSDVGLENPEMALRHVLVGVNNPMAKARGLLKK